MTTKDDFKQQIKAGNIRDALTLSLGEAVELEITTWVSSSSPAPHSSAELDQPTSDCQMRTRMNIVDGEINNEVGSEFMGNGP
ncbi:MAG: hypothetical protein F6K37_25730, partial [Moorea sp. SIO4E2]|nr:hypothetical protein [Moorena sp. SIO4E2]